MCSDFQLRDPLSDDNIVMTLGTIVDGANIPNAKKLNPMKKLSHYFSEPPASEKLHLVLQVPPPGKYQPLHPANVTNICISLFNIVAGHTTPGGLSLAVPHIPFDTI